MNRTGESLEEDRRPLEVPRGRGLSRGPYRLRNVLVYVCRDVIFVSSNDKRSRLSRSSTVATLERLEDHVIEKRVS